MNMAYNLNGRGICLYGGSVGVKALHECGCRQIRRWQHLLLSNLTRSDHDLNAHRRHAIHDYEQECRARDKDRSIGRKLLNVKYPLVVARTSSVRRRQLQESLAHILCQYIVSQKRPSNRRMQLTIACVENPVRMMTTVVELRFCTFPKRSSEFSVRLNDGPPYVN